MRRARFLLVSLSLALAACGGSSSPTCNLAGGEPLVASAWPKFRGDIANTGQSDVDLSSFASTGVFTVDWKVVTGGAVSSSPAIGPAGEIYIGSADSRVYRIDDGTVAWQALTNNTVTTGPALDSVGNVFVTSNDGNFYTFAQSNGVATRGAAAVIGVLSSPNLAALPNAGVAYVGSLSTGLFAVCPNNILRWGSQAVPVAATPALDNVGNVYVAGANNTRTLSSVNPTNGLQNWVFSATAAINSSPIVSPDSTTVYIVDNLGRVFGVNTKTGLSPGVIFDVQSLNPGAQVVASPALGADGTLYIADTRGSLWAVDVATNSLRWHAVVGGAIYSSPIVTADRTVIFGADDGAVYAIADLGDGSALRWSFVPDLEDGEGAFRSSPAVANDGSGTVYIGSNNRRVYALLPPA